ncbi:hypothetical protein C0993_010809 [Termitomyces sp. T159_Od127]|nr:hypothetical protein C0993_010809 [Termitomyces sp. T159_Od127]
MAAIVHEIHRQRAILESGPDVNTASVPQETRGFDEHRFETYKLRSKEDAPDYRYMPDPNLGELVLSKERIQAIRDALPELPWETYRRLKVDYGLSERDVEVLMRVDNGGEVQYDGENSSSISSAVAYFDRLCAGHGSKEGTRRNPKAVVNWMTHELLGQLTARKESFQDNHISAEQMGELIDMVQEKTITGTSGKLLLRHMLANPSQTSTREIARELQLFSFQASDTTSCDTSLLSPDVRTVCADAIAALPEEADAVRKGRKNVLNTIVGRVMKETRGRADARAVKALLEDMIMKEQEL